MLVVGLTGGIGSGKSEVSRMLKTMGYPIYNSDLEARNIVNSSHEVVRKIKSIFGDDSYEHGELNRAKMARLVFNDSALLAQLNAIVHPAVTEHFRDWKKRHAHLELTFKEAAILFESGAYKEVDRVVVVTAPKQLRIDRVCRRDGVMAQQVKERMANQMPEEELVSRADFVINNDEQQPLLPQVVELVNKLKRIKGSEI